MLDVTPGDIWTEYERRADVHLVIPTNGSVRRDGCAVMGRGLALQAARRFPGISRFLGKDLDQQTDWPTITILPYRLIAFPVKYQWMERAELVLIEQSANRLAKWLAQDQSCRVILPCVGCGNGRLTWDQVRPRLKALDMPELASRVQVIDTARIR